MRIALILCAALLSGCGTFSFNMDVAATYRSDKPLAAPLSMPPASAPK